MIQKKKTASNAVNATTGSANANVRQKHTAVPRLKKNFLSGCNTTNQRTTLAGGYTMADNLANSNIHKSGAATIFHLAKQKFLNFVAVLKDNFRHTHFGSVQNFVC